MYVEKLDENKKQWSGIKILLIKDGSILESALTPALFENLPQGTYIVREVIPEGYESTGPTEYKFTIVDEHLFHNYTFGPSYLPEPVTFKNHQVYNRANVKKIAPAKGSYRIPSWNVPGRPKNPRIGTVGFNIQTNKLEVWNGSLWLKLAMKKIK